MEWRTPMTNVTTTAAVVPSAAAPTESTTAAVTDLQAYRRERAAQQMAQKKLSAKNFHSAPDGWSLSAFHPLAASARTNLR
jgi:hypothetical protein